MHARVLLFIPYVFFLLHDSLPKITFLPNSLYIQQTPNIDMCLVSSHLNLMYFVDLSYDHLELLRELHCLQLGLHGLLLECIQYLHCNIIAEHPCLLFLSLCHVRIFFFRLCNDLCCPFLEQFHLSMALLFLCLWSYDFYMQFLHILCSFDALRD
jgi:hypothetical protein